ncbi:MAG: glycosyltransferase, partial [Moorea sp. SIO2B7]|nr:glycosyltransferase [Moorena sp. SIO2B7]
MHSPISIIITIYNRQHYLDAALKSILAQTRRDFELLIWDDGSTDNSVALCRQYAQQDRRVRVVAAKHQGRVKSLKNAIAQTKGTYLGWVDSDDLLAPTALEETASVLDTHPDVGWVYTDYIDIDQNSTPIGYGQCCSIPYSKEGLLYKFMTFQFRLIRRCLFEQAGGIREEFDYAQDYDLCLRLSEISKLKRLKKPLYYYRQHP